MNFEIKQFVFLSLILISAKTYSAENLFYANYAEIDKVVWSYLAESHPEIDSKEFKISVYSFEKVLGKGQEDLINVILNYEIENSVTKKRVSMHGKATFRGSLPSEKKHDRTMTLQINPAGQVVKETTRKTASEN